MGFQSEGVPDGSDTRRSTRSTGTVSTSRTFRMPHPAWCRNGRPCPVPGAGRKRKPTMNRLVLVLAVASLTGCATVKSSYVRPDYESVDKTQVKHLAVVTQPLPDGNPKVGELWSLVAR